MKDDNRLELTGLINTPALVESTSEMLKASQVSVDAQAARLERSQKELERLPELAASQTIPDTRRDECVPKLIGDDHLSHEPRLQEVWNTCRSGNLACLLNKQDNVAMNRIHCCLCEQFNLSRLHRRDACLCRVNVFRINSESHKSPAMPRADNRGCSYPSKGLQCDISIVRTRKYHSLGQSLRLLDGIKGIARYKFFGLIGKLFDIAPDVSKILAGLIEFGLAEWTIDYERHALEALPVFKLYQLGHTDGIKVSVIDKINAVGFTKQIQGAPLDQLLGEHLN